MKIKLWFALPGEDKITLLANAQRRGDGPIPAKGFPSASSGILVVKDAQTSTMPLPAVPSSASTGTDAAAAGASSSAKEDASQPLVAKGPPSPSSKGTPITE